MHLAHQTAMLDVRACADLRLAPRPLPPVIITGFCKFCIPAVTPKKHLINGSDHQSRGYAEDLHACAPECSRVLCLFMASCQARGFRCSYLDVDVQGAANELYRRHETKRKMTSGWIGAYWANLSCATVDMYGFPLWSSTSHYYSAEDAQTGQLPHIEAVKHDIAHEHSLFRQIFAGGGGASERVRFWDRERKQVGGGRP